MSNQQLIYTINDLHETQTTIAQLQGLAKELLDSLTEHMAATGGERKALSASF